MVNKLKQSPIFRIFKDKSVARKDLIESTFLSVLSVILLLLSPLGIQYFVDKLRSPDSWRYLLIAAILLILQGFFQAAGLYLTSRWAETNILNIRNHLFKHIVHLPISSKTFDSPSKLAGPLVSDTEVIRKLLANTVPELITGTLTIVGGVTFLFLISWQITLAMILMLSILFVVVNIVSSITGRLYTSRQSKLTNYISSISIFVNEIRLIKASNAEINTTKKIGYSTQSLYDNALQIAKVGSWMSPLIMSSAFMVFFVLFSFGGILVSSHLLTIGSLITFLIYLFQILTPITSIGDAINHLNAANGAAKHLISITGEEEESNDGAMDIPEISTQTISFNDVYFSYNNKSVIKGITLRIDGPCNVALVGPSGGGKTTLLDLLERFYIPESGEILLGNTPISSYGLYSWRSLIGYVTQESTILGETIREAMLFATSNQVTQGKIEEVLKEVNLWGEISNLPLGLDTKLTEHGGNLSGGQIQRLMIARTLLRDPKIILLDEATANLDADSENDVMKTMNNIKKDKIVITIAHRLSTIKNADKIYFVENGTVSGVGTHEQLLKNHAGYARYVHEQEI